MFCQFLLYSKVNQVYIHIYPLFLRVDICNVGHYRAVSRVPCAIQQVLISQLFYIQQCVYVSPNLPIYLYPPIPLVTISLFSTSVTISVTTFSQSSFPQKFLLMILTLLCQHFLLSWSLFPYLFSLQIVLLTHSGLCQECPL